MTTFSIRFVRCLVVWLVAALVAGATAQWLWPAVEEGVRAALGDPRGPSAFVALVTGLASLALVACAGWAWVVTTAVLVEEAVGVGSPRVRGLAPDWARRLVLGACGLALVSTMAPAHADVQRDHGGGRHESRLSGLPLPDRATGGLPSPRASGHDVALGRPVAEVVVRPGDSLWSISARRLGPHADEAAVAAATRDLYAANRARIGADPDLITVGLRLRVPLHLRVAPTRPQRSADR